MAHAVATSKVLGQFVNRGVERQFNEVRLGHSTMPMTSIATRERSELSAPQQTSIITAAGV